MLEHVVFILFYSTIITANQGSVQNSNLLKYGRYSGATYCDSIYKNKTWKCGQICSSKIVSKTRVIAAIIDEQKQGAVQISINTEQSDIIIAFRGSHTLENVIQNIKFYHSKPDWVSEPGAEGKANSSKPEEYRMVNKQTIRGKIAMVHAGFEQTYARLRGITRIIKTAAERYPWCKIVFTGHSLGGALSILAAVDFYQTFNFGRRISVYTYGSPRIGNLDWADYVSTLPFAERITRFAFYGDPVVQLPPLWVKYVHHKTQAMVRENASTVPCEYKKGDHESQRCYWPPNASNLKSHFKYAWGGSADHC